MTRSARSTLIATVALGLALAATAPAGAADYRLPASEYGKVSLASKQSLGDAADMVSSQENVFEPMGLLREDDPLRKLTRAVGRLDILVDDNGEEFMTSCTGTIVNDGDAVLTASHCIPGFEGKVIEASLLLDYFDADSDTIRLNVGTEPMAYDTGLDFALVPLLDPVPSDVLPVSIARADVLPGERLTMVHHPAGLPKKLTQYGCRATSSLSAETNLRHRCDTLPGSSGAPILNANREIVGTHHTGGMTGDDPNSFNAGTRIVTILAATDLLETPADAGDPRDSDTGVAAASAGDGATTAAAGPAETAPDAAAAFDSLIEATEPGAVAGAGEGASVEGTVNEIIEGNP